MLASRPQASWKRQLLQRQNDYGKDLLQPRRLPVWPFRSPEPMLLPAVTSSARTPVANRILSKLTRPEYERLGPSLEPVNMTEDQMLYGPGDSVRHIYFPNDAIFSLLLEVDQRRTVEVAMVGNEGTVGLAVQLRGVNPHSLFRVRLAGTALRLELAALAGLGDQQGNELPELLRADSTNAASSPIAAGRSKSRTTTPCGPLRAPVTR